MPFLFSLVILTDNFPLEYHLSQMHNRVTAMQGLAFDRAFRQWHIRSKNDVSTIIISRRGSDGALLFGTAAPRLRSVWSSETKK